MPPAGSAASFSRARRYPASTWASSVPIPYAVSCEAIHRRKSAHRFSNAADCAMLFRYQTREGEGSTAESKTILRTCEGKSFAYSAPKYEPYDAPMNVSFRSPRPARTTSRSRALFSEWMCRSRFPPRSAHPRAYASASAFRPAFCFSVGCSGACQLPSGFSRGSRQESGADRPTPRGAYPTRSYTEASRFHSGKIPTSGKSIPEEPGPPGLKTSAPCRSFFGPAALARLTVRSICSPSGRA